MAKYKKIQKHQNMKNIEIIKTLKIALAVKNLCIY